MAVSLAFGRALLTSPNRCDSPKGIPASTASAIRRSYWTAAVAPEPRVWRQRSQQWYRRVSKPPSNGRKADAERKPSLLLRDRPLPGLAPVLVDVIFETIERIGEQDDTVLLTEQRALAAFEIADYLYVPEFGKLNMLGDAPKLLDESFVTAANLEGHW